jgi:hypothetical protein
MLSAKIDKLMKEAVSMAMRDVPSSVPARLNSLKAADARKGFIGSSSALELNKRQVFYDVYQESAKGVWTEMRRVLVQAKVAYGTNLESDLRALFSQFVTPLFNSLDKPLGALPKILVASNRLIPFSSHRSQVDSMILNEIGVYCAGLEAHQLEKERSCMEKSPININVSGLNARVNWNSSDSSTNTANSSFSFGELRVVIDAQISDVRLKAQLKDKATVMENSLGDRNALKKAYDDFMDSAANHVTALGPIIPALAEFMANRF